MAVNGLCCRCRIVDDAAQEKPRAHALLALAGGFTQVSAPVRAVHCGRDPPAVETDARSAIPSFSRCGPDYAALCACGSAACAAGSFSCRSGIGDAYAACCRANDLVHWIWSAVALLVRALAADYPDHPRLQTA